MKNIFFAVLYLLLISFTNCMHVKEIESVRKMEDIGSTLQLFVDDSLIDRMNRLSFTLHTPDLREVVFVYDKPWEGLQTGYITMLEDQGVYRMYYRGGGDETREYTSLAESRDGISWTRPELGLVEVEGSKKNNVIWTGKEKGYCESHNFSPFIDQNPAALPEQRYKAVALGRHIDEKGERKIALVAMASPDGIHWKRIREDAIITEGAFDSHNTAFWDVVEKRYVCNIRVGREGWRSIARCTSADFLSWTRPEQLDFGDTPLEHLYTNGIVQYFREPRFYFGFPMRFVPARKTIGFVPREIDGTSDAVFLSSRDGLHWDRRFMEAFIRPGLNPNNWGNAHGNLTPAWGILKTAENEMSLYWVENGVEMPRLRRGALRMDGFVSLKAPYSGGESVTRPLIFNGSRLILNYSTSAVGRIRVEMQDPEGTPIPGFEEISCDEIYGDEISRIVSWGKNPDVSALSGKPVRLRFLLKDADLYSFRFTTE